MEKVIKLNTLVILLCINFTMCTNYEHKNTINSAKIIEFSLNYILTHNHLVKEYYNQPIQIINLKNFPIKNSIEVNGKIAILLPDTTDSYLLLKNRPIFNPIPLVEISNIKNERKDIISINLILRSTGHLFSLKLKENKNGDYAVISITERTI